MKQLAALTVLVFAACTSSPDQPLPSLTGTYQGTGGNGYTMRYVFGADGSFQYGPVESNTFDAIGTGTFTFGDDNDTPLLTLTATVTDEEDGTKSNVKMQTLAYASGRTFCDSAYYPAGGAAPPANGVVASWSASSTTWPLDANGNPGAPNLSSDTYAFASDSTFQETALDGSSTSGTYTFAGAVVTATTQSGNVESVRSLTRVDGIVLEGSDAVLCDPVFTLQ